MKKIILVFIAVISFTATYGQSKWHIKQNNYYAEQAAIEFNLNDSQKDEVKEIRIEMVRAFTDSNYEFKEGFITDEERKQENKTASRKFNSAFCKLVGKPYNQVEPFFTRMREEIKNLK